MKKLFIILAVLFTGLLSAQITTKVDVITVETLGVSTGTDEIVTRNGANQLSDSGLTVDDITPYTGLEAVDEGQGIGYRLKDRAPRNSGLGGVDLSFFSSGSTNKGASGDYSFASGESVWALGDHSAAIGRGVITAGEISFGSGESVEAPSFAEFSIGMNPLTYTASSSTAWVGTDRIFNIGNGNGANSNVVTVLKNAEITFQSTTATEIDSAGDFSAITRKYYYDNLPLDNEVIINDASDFPAAVAGVIELVPFSGAAITYTIAGKNIDMGSDRFTVTDGDIVMKGNHRTESTLTTTNATVFFTVVDAAFFPEFIGFDCSAATVIDFSTPVETFKSLTLDNVIIRDCDEIAVIDGAFTTSLRTLSVVTTQSGGITWTGADNGQINISQMLGIDWTGTLLDLGTATFDIINIGTGNRFISPSGTTILSGAAASANLTATGRGLVTNNLFNGLGTALGGIDTMDLKWNFIGNTFVDGTTLNSREVSDAFLTASTTATIGSIGVYVAVGGVNWSSDISDRFTVSTAGLITYIGLKNIEVAISGHSTVEKDGGGTDKICTKIAINGTVVDKTISCTENATATGVASIGLFTLSTGDTIQLFTGNEGSTADVIASESTILVIGG